MLKKRRKKEKIKYHIKSSMSESISKEKKNNTEIAK